MKKYQRIRKNEEFQKLISLKHSLANRAFVVYYAPRNKDNARAGISVSKKMGNAVVRNKIKRQIRMIIHELVDFNTYPCDLIVIVRKNFLDNSYDVNKKLLEKLLKKVTIV